MSIGHRCPHKFMLIKNYILDPKVCLWPWIYRHKNIQIHRFTYCKILIYFSIKTHKKHWKCWNKKVHLYLRFCWFILIYFTYLSIWLLHCTHAQHKLCATDIWTKLNHYPPLPFTPPADCSPEGSWQGSHGAPVSPCQPGFV